MIDISVIVPIYNVEKYLDDCLSSLERQTFQSIEVILVNDGSTDSSEKIAKKYVDKNENFRLICRENGGQSAARNTGLKVANGKYIYFLDSDDYLVDNALEELYCKAEKEQLDVLKFGAYTFEEDSVKEKTWTDYRYKGKYTDICKGTELLRSMYEYGDNVFSSCCMIFSRRKIINENKLLFYEGIIYEDNLFHWQLLAVSERVGILNKPLYCRRVREGSTTTTPQYYNKWRSLVISADRADRFFNNFDNLKGSKIDVFYRDFLYDGIENGYMLMDKDLKNSNEVKKLHKLERKLLFKWCDLSHKGMILYAVSPELYIWIKKMKNIN